LANSGITPGTTNGNGAMAIGAGSAADGDYANAVGTNANAKGKDTSAFGANSKVDGEKASAFGAGSQALANNASAIGAGANVAATATNGSAFGVDSAVNAQNGLALGANSVVQAGATNSVALGQGSIANRPNTVSVGSVGNERVITNVAPGEISATSTDAVNGSQVYDLVQNQSNTVLSQVHETNVRMDRVGAMSAAMSSLKPYFVDGTEKGQIMAGVGAYHGEKALALGYGYAPNDRVFLNASVGISKSEQMYGMGATWRIGVGESAPKRDNSTVKQLQAENDQLQDRVAKLEALVQQLIEAKA